MHENIASPEMILYRRRKTNTSNNSHFHAKVYTWQKPSLATSSNVHSEQSSHCRERSPQQYAIPRSILQSLHHDDKKIARRTQASRCDAFTNGAGHNFEHREIENCTNPSSLGTEGKAQRCFTWKKINCADSKRRRRSRCQQGDDSCSVIYIVYSGINPDAFDRSRKWRTPDGDDEGKCAFTYRSNPRKERRNCISNHLKLWSLANYLRLFNPFLLRCSFFFFFFERSTEMGVRPGGLGATPTHTPGPGAHVKRLRASLSKPLPSGPTTGPQLLNLGPVAIASQQFQFCCHNFPYAFNNFLFVVLAFQFQILS